MIIQKKHYFGLPFNISIIRPGFLKEWKYIISPKLPSVKAGQNMGILFFAAQ